MARSYRNTPEDHFYRRIKTNSEIKQNRQLFADLRADDIPYSISGVNRMRRYIPDSWDDLPISAKTEEYHAI